jgi:hypothetical protein
MPLSIWDVPGRYNAPRPQTPISYRTDLVAADVMAVPGTVTCTKINSVGALTANTYYVKVVAVNAYGRTTPTAGNTTVTTETTNLCIKAAFAQVTGATHYDIYCSTASNPLWCGRITEAQRASGIVIDAVGSTAAGGAVNSVYIYPVGTGLAADTTAAVNTAYVPPAATIDCTRFNYCAFDVACTRTGDAAAAALVLTPFFYNSRAAAYYAGTPQTLTFGGATGVYTPMRQRLNVEVRGCEQVVLLVQSLAGTGLSVNIDYTLN